MQEQAAKVLLFHQKVVQGGQKSTTARAQEPVYGSSRTVENVHGPFFSGMHVEDVFSFSQLLKHSDYRTVNPY
jgi:hypothetical protein